MKIALIGGKDIKKYTIAPIVWNAISKELGIKIDYHIFSIKDRNELQNFIHDFNNDKNFLAFNIALPWKRTIKQLLNNGDNETVYNEINTVYKSTKGIQLTNTDIPGLLLAINGRVPQLNNKKILVIGCGGVGYPLTEKLIVKNPETLVYDIEEIKAPFDIINKKDFLEEKLNNKNLDIIINCSPIGKSYLGEKENDHRIPVDFSFLRNTINAETLIVECNYYQLETPLLKLGKLLGAETIRGVEMLVNQAIITMSLTIDTEFKNRLYGHILNEVIKDDVFQT